MTAPINAARCNSAISESDNAIYPAPICTPAAAAIPMMADAIPVRAVCGGAQFGHRAPANLFPHIAHRRTIIFRRAMNAARVPPLPPNQGANSSPRESRQPGILRLRRRLSPPLHIISAGWQKICVLPAIKRPDFRAFFRPKPAPVRRFPPLAALHFPLLYFPSFFSFSAPARLQRALQNRQSRFMPYSIFRSLPPAAAAYNAISRAALC